MSSHGPDAPLDCAIVGGGIHGTHLAVRLLADGTVERDDLVIIDPYPDLLDAFRLRCRACGTETLRSATVHHVGPDAFGLERFAVDHGREDELVSTVDYPDRPSLDLFIDHARHVVERHGLARRHRRATVGRVSCRTDGSYRIETDDGALRARNCVLALGHGGRLRQPAWAEDVAGATHVWEGLGPDRSERGAGPATSGVAPSPRRGRHTLVVGGGITAAQLAATLFPEERVTLCTRHPLEWKVAEAAPAWVTWRHVEAELHARPPGSADRLRLVKRARNDATVPPWLYGSFEEALRDGRLAIEQGTVRTAADRKDGVELGLEHGRRLPADRILLATGLQPEFDVPILDRIATTLGLQRGARGVPVLDDATLAWRRSGADESAVRSSVYVSGAFAAASVGPYAGNLPGARRAAERIRDALANATTSTRSIESRASR